MKREAIIEIISSLLLLLFLYAALSKITLYSVFVFQVGESPFKLLAQSAHWIAWLIPAIELVVAFLLPFNKTRLTALYLSAGLLTVFTIYIGAMQISGLPLPCACGGIISGLRWKGHLLFNVFFLLISLLGIKLETKHKTKILQKHDLAHPVGPI